MTPHLDVQGVRPYLADANASLADVAQVAALLAERGMVMRGL